MASLQKLAMANNTFGFDLLRRISEDEKKSNIFYSPFSISAALSMVMLGSRGDTHKQISEVLCFTEADRPDPAQQQNLMQSQMQMQPPIGRRDLDVHEDFSEMLKMLEEIASVNFASRLYGEQSFRFLKEFLNQTKDKYGAELEAVDFKNAAEGARLNINQWVQVNTAGKIKNLLPLGSVGALTAVVLVNAIHLKDKWRHPFNEKESFEGPFRMNERESKNGPMMYQEAKHMYAEIKEEQIKLLEMFYEDKRLSMIILLPNNVGDDTTGLETLEQALTYDKLMSWTKMMHQRKVQVKLPKFKLENTYDMNDILKKMGMVDAFDRSRSNLSGISEAHDLVLSKVVHKAYVQVNEEGTEAAAATGVVITTTSFEMPVYFIADHPFLFFILHNPTNTILFAGRFCEPV